MPKKLRSFPGGIADGPTGTSASQIIQAVVVQHQTSAVDVLTDFINHLASGLVPVEIQPI